MTVNTNDPDLVKKIDPKLRHFCFLVHEVFTATAHGQELWKSLLTILDMQVKADDELAINVGKQNYVRWLKQSFNIHSRHQVHQ